MNRIVLLIGLVGLLPTEGARRRCINNGILFPDKILSSPIVVYGESIGKRVYVDTDTELLFNVTLRVDCILKGQDVEHQIEITQAGSSEFRLVRLMVLSRRVFQESKQVTWLVIRSSLARSTSSFSKSGA